MLATMTLTLNSFAKGGDGKYRNGSEKVVALSSTGWYDHKSRCGKNIRSDPSEWHKSVLAQVVDECDSVNGCDNDHDFQPPCSDNIVDTSQAVWKALAGDLPERRRV